MVEIITIGDEIIIGQIVDTNSAKMAKVLHDAGFRVSRISSVSDDGAAIRKAVENALEAVDIVLLTGGLGPTKDDITKKTLGEVFGGKMICDQTIIENIERLFRGRSLSINELTRQQALVPESCRVIQNRVGTAPVMWFERQGKVVVSMPGVPFEMETVLNEEVVPQLKERFEVNNLLYKTVQVYGYGESALAMKIEEWEISLPPHLSLAYLPSMGVVKLRLSGMMSDRGELEKEMESYLEELRRILGRAIFAENDWSVERNLGVLLRKNKMKIAIAESCTGGNIAHKITTVSGSSDYFLGGVVAYHNEVKEEILGVNPDVILQYGAVSGEVAEQMAVGVIEKVGGDCALAVTGVSGPDGGSVEKPVGTVWVAVAVGGRVESRLFYFGNYPRNVLIERFSIAAMLMLMEKTAV